ncbi:MAG: hypothetical protein ACXWD4_06590 [Bacteroidia bacterium]
MPKVHEELKGLDLNINEFGEIISNIDIDKVNEFLTRSVPDKKLINRNDDAYQQDFKAMGYGKGGDDEDIAPFIEDSTEDDDDNLPFVVDTKVAADDEAVDPEIVKDVEALDEGDLEAIKKNPNPEDEI